MRTRAGRGPLELTDQPFIVVDDGLATGATVRAAVTALRGLGPAEIVVAVPVGSRSACEEPTTARQMAASLVRRGSASGR